MLAMLQAWQGKVEVNGVLYDNIGAVSPCTPLQGDIHIKLYPATVKRQETAGNGENKPILTDSSEIKITVKAYMTRTATPDFDFMAKWNNNNPMPLRTMQGSVDNEKSTKGMYYMHLHGVGQKEIRCMRCGKELTHPVSRHYGIGPECMKKLGIVADIDDVENIKEQLVNVEWQGYVIKSAVTEWEVVNE